MSFLSPGDRLANNAAIFTDKLMAEHILVIEDEPSIADTLVYALRTEGFEVHWSSLAADGYEYLQNNEVNLVVLDVGLPDTNGFELCKQIRRISDVPVIFLTARKEEVDRIVGLEIGGDDYVTKPFSPRELTARIKVVLRRVQMSSAPATTLLQSTDNHGIFRLNESKAQIHYKDELLDLTRYEYLILKTMLQHPEQVYSRAQLMDKVWDEPEASFERAVDTHIKSLRAKLRDICADSNPIKTHRGMGYSLHIN